MPSQEMQQNSKWTMMVYLAGDNNLSEEMVWALQEMEGALSLNVEDEAGEPQPVSRFLDVIAQFDASGATPKRFTLGRNNRGVARHTCPELQDVEQEDLLPKQLASVEPQPEQRAVARFHLRGNELAPILEALPVPSEVSGQQDAGRERMSLMISILTKAVELEEYEPSTKHGSMKAWLDRLDRDIRTLGSAGLGEAALQSGDAGSPVWCEDPGQEKAEKVLAEKIARAPLEIASSVQAGSFTEFIGHQVDIASPKTTKLDNQRHMIVLSGHGSGAIGDFLTDSDPPGSLSIPKLGRLLDRALAEVKRVRPSAPTDMKIAILGMDSCMMSMVEVCAEVQDAVEFLIGSEGFVANTGWPYHLVIRQLARLASSGSDQQVGCVAKSIVDEYTRFYRDYERAGTSTQIAAIDLKQLNALQKALRDFVDAVLGILNAPFERLGGGDSQEVSEFRSTIQDYAYGVSDLAARRLISRILSAHWRSQTYKMGQYVDIWDFCSNLRQELDVPEFAGISEALRAVMHGIEGTPVSAVIASNYCGPDFQHSHGLSIYFPWSIEDLAPEYRNLRFDQKTNWFQFLEVFLTLTQRERRGEFSFGNTEDPVPFQYYSDSEALVEALFLSPIRRGMRPPGKVKDGLHAAVRTGLHAAVRTGVHAAVRGGHHGDSRFAGGGGSRTGIHGASRGFAGGAPIETVFQNGPRGFYHRERSDPNEEIYSGDQARAPGEPYTLSA